MQVIRDEPAELKARRFAFKLKSLGITCRKSATKYAPSGTDTSDAADGDVLISFFVSEKKDDARGDESNMRVAVSTVSTVRLATHRRRLMSVHPCISE